MIIYIDGFNLYFGIVKAGLYQCKWLNLERLIKNISLPHQELIEINYFTSRVTNDPDKQKRQTIFIEALETTGIKIFYGHYQSSAMECIRCGNIWRTYNEKMTDVNIATQMIMDAYQDRYDMAMLISGDSDLVPPIKAIHANFPNKRVFVAFPPKRYNASVASVAKGSFIIGRKKLVDSQFPDEVCKSSGFILRRPDKWK